MHIVGLADAGVREGRVRIRGALENSGFKLPPRKITVNLAPAALRKDGAAFDVPIAVGMLCAAGVLDAAATAETRFVGELALDSSLQPVRGVLPIAAWARAHGVRRLVVPPQTVKLPVSMTRTNTLTWFRSRPSVAVMATVCFHLDS